MNVMKLRFLIAILSLMLLVGCASDTSASDAEAGKVNAVATIGMVGDIVENVGGDHVQVTVLMGPGVDPHLYAATEGDVGRLVEADIIFYNGLNLEARMADVLEEIGESRLTVAIGGSIAEDRLLVHAGYNAPDPHIWMDVELWMAATESVRDALIAFDPANEASYTENTEAYLAELRELEAYVAQRIASIPEQQRVLITAHDAFQYFGVAYGIEVFAPQGITTEAEAGVDDIRRIIELAVERDIPAIFVESSVPPDVVEAIIEGAAARNHNLEIGGSLYSDAMGQAGTEDGTYIGMIRHNVDTIADALIGSD